MSYKKLGDIVKFISNKNVDGIATILYGINIDKYFMPSVANTIGVDLKKYKVVVKNQFACNRMHVGRDERLPISMSTFDYPFIVSPAYDVFEVTDENVIPEYLMLWFRRSEFDRQCWFYTDADVRGGLSLDALKSIEIRIPSIEKQREIVAQYQAVENKIKVNEQICEKLEATAQTLYKQWFIDFEFPNEEGKPYKSSGGKMVWNEELEKEIPEGWEVKNLEQVVKIFAGGDKPKVFSTVKTDNCKVPIYSNGLDNKGLYGFTNKSVFPKNSITVSARGTIGYCELRREDYVGIVRLLTLIPNHDLSSIYLFYFLQNFDFDASGSVQNQLTKPQVSEIQILYPEKLLLEQFYHIVNKIVNKKEFKNTENQKLSQLQSLLLSRLATLEG